MHFVYSQRLVLPVSLSSFLHPLVILPLILILTSVENASVNYHSETEKQLGRVSVSELKAYMEEGHFEDNTMLPKIQASIEFVEEKPGRTAVITSIGKAKEGYLEKTGTVITA